MLAQPRRGSPRWKSPQLSKANVLKVVKPPANPVVRNNRSRGSIAVGLAVSKVPAHPIQALPATLTNRVAHGKSAPNQAPKAYPATKRVNEPIAPPIKTA